MRWSSQTVSHWQLVLTLWMNHIWTDMHHWSCAVEMYATTTIIVTTTTSITSTQWHLPADKPCHSVAVKCVSIVTVVKVIHCTHDMTQLWPDLFQFHRQPFLLHLRSPVTASVIVSACTHCTAATRPVSLVTEITPSSLSIPHAGTPVQLHPLFQPSANVDLSGVSRGRDTPPGNKNEREGLKMIKTNTVTHSCQKPTTVTVNWFHDLQKTNSSPKYK